jgi:hypothetical protein
MEIASRPPIPELWGATEIAHYLGIERPNLYKIKGLPEPVAQLERGRLWLADEIREWARATGRAK